VLDPWGHVRYRAGKLRTRQAAGTRRAVVIEPGQSQKVRDLEIFGGEGVHRVTAAAAGAAAARPRDLARQPASGTDRLSRVRGHSERHEHGHDDDQAGEHALLR
jgi:hypothetical protein